MAPFIYVLCQSQNSLLRMVIYFLKFKHIHNTLTSIYFLQATLFFFVWPTFIVSYLSMNTSLWCWNLAWHVPTFTSPELLLP